MKNLEAYYVPDIMLNCWILLGFFLNLILFLFFKSIYLWLHGVFFSVCGLSLLVARGACSPAVGYGLLLVAASRCKAWASGHTGLIAPKLVGSSQIGDRTRVLCIPRQSLNHWTTQETQDSVVLNPHKLFYLYYDVGEKVRFTHLSD